MKFYKKVKTGFTMKLIKNAVLEKSEKEDDTDRRIIGGSPASPGQFPWAAALFYRGRFICSASIIGESSVLTAAHCVQDGNRRTKRAEAFYAVANVNKSAPSVRLRFDRLVVHPKYGNLENDIAIFRTVQPIQFNDEVKPVCVAAPNTPMDAYGNATAMGWGNTSPIREIIIVPDILQYVEQTVFDNRFCFLLGAPGVTDTKLCATGFFNGVCNGDSGGPLAHMSADKPPVEIGITSYGNGVVGCGKISPGVWTRISSYYDFIMQNTVGDAVCVV